MEQIKGLYVEPRGKVGFAETIEDFYEKIHDPEMKGAIFFAVCRGKVSLCLYMFQLNWIIIINLLFNCWFTRLSASLIICFKNGLKSERVIISCNDSDIELSPSGTDS